MGKRMGAKLRSRAGESIAETLVALLISALALLMLAGAVTSAANMVTTSSKQMAKYYSADNDLVRQAGNGGGSVVLTGEDITGEKLLNVGIDINNAFGGTPVVSYHLSAGD